VLKRSAIDCSVTPQQPTQSAEIERAIATPHGDFLNALQQQMIDPALAYTHWSAISLDDAIPPSTSAG
jgi:hypothetical protein